MAKNKRVENFLSRLPLVGRALYWSSSLMWLCTKTDAAIETIVRIVVTLSTLGERLDNIEEKLSDIENRVYVLEEDVMKLKVWICTRSFSISEVHFFEKKASNSSGGISTAFLCPAGRPALNKATKYNMPITWW